MKSLSKLMLFHLCVASIALQILNDLYSLERVHMVPDHFNLTVTTRSNSIHSTNENAYLLVSYAKMMFAHKT